MTQKQQQSRDERPLLDRLLALTFIESEDRRLREDRIRDLLPQQDDSFGKAYDPQLVRRLAAYARPFLRQFILAIVLMVARSGFAIAAPWIVGRAIDDGIRNGDLATLRNWTLLFAASAVGEWITNRARIMIMAVVGTRVVADVRSDLFRHLLRLSLNFFNNYSVGRLMSRLNNDVQVLLGFITWSITGLFRAGTTLVGIIVILFAMNWRLALVALAVLPLMFFLTRFWSVRVRDTYRQTRQRISLINGYLNESISGIRVTKSFVREARNMRHFDDLNQSYFEANVRATLLSALYFPGIDFLASLGIAAVVGVGGWLVLGNALTAGTLVAFILYVERFFDPVRELADRYNSFQSAMASSERIFALMDTDPDLQDASEAYDLPPINGQVDFDNVSFAYEDGDPVLRAMELRVTPGQRVALVGETGAGKTTLVKLLARFFDVREGAIAIDGHDIRRVTQASLRSQLGIVSQDTFLFSGTVADNIRYGRLDATEEEIAAAAQTVGAHDFILRLPEGYATDVGENGVNLSVGQRQVLACARAMLADPRILIMDEATSSVDSATEKQIQYAMDQLMQGRTTFVIAHRLNTVVGADQIIVIEDGQIVEQGRHAELLERRGRYYDLYTLQWAREEGQETKCGRQDAGNKMQDD
jgi:ATP-binding cassette subfamily B multidrug efflux pump